MGVPALTSLTQPFPGQAVITDFIQCFFPSLSWRPVEERMGNSDVINLGHSGTEEHADPQGATIGAHVFVPRRW